MFVQVVAAACIVTADVDIDGIHDSKSISEAEREAIYERLIAHPGVRYGVYVNPSHLPISSRVNLI
jgi:ribonuclease HII